METSSNKTTATITHLSTLSQYFIPFGSFIFPIIIWSAAKKDSNFVDAHGRQAINFQLSLFVYSLILALIAIPVLLFTIFRHVPFADFINNDDFIIENLSPSNISGIVVIAVVAVLLFCAMKVAEFFLVIFAAVKAANGEVYQYPFTINFLKRIDAANTNTTSAQPEA